MRVLILCLALALVGAGCDGNTIVQPPNPADLEDWSFPIDTSKVALTAMAPDTGYVGQSFDVKIVVYNVPQLFGAAADVQYERDRVRVESVIIGPLFGSSKNTLGVAFVDSARGIVQVASTLRSGAPSPSRATGVLCKLRCRALRTGLTRFRLDGNVILKTATGTDVTGGVRREEDRTQIVP